MPRVALDQGAYTADSVIASAQRALNIFPEKNPDDALVKFTHYSCPGLTPLASPPTPGPGRGLYMSNVGILFYVCGGSVFQVSPSFQLTLLGSIDIGFTPVSMADNGTTMILVDGTSSGYQVSLSTQAFSPISESTNAPTQASTDVYGFFGADRVDILDGFLLLNQPGTRNFYCTQNNNVVFDALNFAAKNGYSDNLVVAVVTAREIWLIGQRTTEIWFDAGAAAFPFQIMPGPFVQHGCSAKYSVAQVDAAIFWLSQDQAGQNIVVRGKGYAASRISTHAIEAEFATYATVSDAIGFCYQQSGHAFYMLTFPTADKTWCWDEMTGLWHQRAWTDTNGVEHRHRANCAAFAYGTNVVADWETGQLYAFDPKNHTDAGAPMHFRRGFPHMMGDGNRVIYPGFSLDVLGGTSPDTTVTPRAFPLTISNDFPNNGPLVVACDDELLAGPAPPFTQPPVVNLRWSDDHGATWGQPVPQTFGATGQRLTQPKWRRLGMARDRVFECYGVIPGPLAINGAFIDPPITLRS